MGHWTTDLLAMYLQHCFHLKKTKNKSKEQTQSLHYLFAFEVSRQRVALFRLTFDIGVRAASVYLWVYWQLSAGWWEAWSSLWGHWTLLLVESRCPASPLTARTLSPHCPWLHLRSTPQSSPVDKKCVTLKRGQPQIWRIKAKWKATFVLAIKSSDSISQHKLS